MKNSKLWSVLSGFSTRDWRAFDNFLASPYFNQREDVRKLADYVFNSRKKKPSKEAAFQLLFPGKKYEEKALRHRMSYLFSLLQTFLIQEELAETPMLSRPLLGRALRKRGQSRSFQIEQKKSLHLLGKQEFRHAEFHRWRYEILLENYGQDIIQSRSRSGKLSALNQDLNIFYISTKLRHACTALSHKLVSHLELNEALLPEIFNFIEGGDYLEQPAVNIYYNAYKALEKPGQEAYFTALKSSIQKFGKHFPKEELRDIYLLAINYCIRQLNAGEKYFLEEVFGIYQDGLQQEVFLDNGILSRFTYNNIVTAALGLKAFEWAHTFIYEYRDRIEKEFREHTFHYNLAIYYYKIPDYDQALHYLRAVATDDILHGLEVRRMMVKIYFEKNEWNALISLLESFKHYLYRQTKVGYHRNNYLNFIRYLKKLMKLDSYDKKAVLNLQEAIQNQKVLADKEWLLKQLPG